MNISFFIATFTSISWLIYSLRFISTHSLSGVSSLEAVYQNVTITLLPVIVIWGIFAIIKNHFTQRRTTYHIYNLLEQVKKNAENISDFGQVLLNTQMEIKNSYIVQEFNLLISDINEILSDIVKRSNSVSSAQIEHLCTRTAAGERWLMAKTFIEINSYQTGFSDHLLQKAAKDILLKGSILEFNSRYKTIYLLMQESENKKTFLNMLEYGALGKVYEILTPIAKNLLENKIPAPQKHASATAFEKTDFSLSEEPISFPSFLSPNENKPYAAEPTISIPEKKDSQSIEDGLRAIREEILSSSETSTVKQEPVISVMSGFSKTEMALNSVKQDTEKKEKTTRKTPVISLDELEEEINASPENNYDEYAYPFGAWLDGKKNK